MTMASQVPAAPPPTQVSAPVRPKQRRRWAGWGFIGPFMFFFAVIFVAPIIYSIYLSLFRDQLVGGNFFVGLGNYQEVLTDATFWRSFGRVVLFLLVQVPIMLLLAMLVALAIDSARLYGSSFFRIAIFLPYAVPAVVASLMWGFMYGRRFGLIGNIDRAFGISLPDPLSSELVLVAIGNINTWEFTGYNMLIFYAALRAIPRDLYEAAEIDGASQLRIISAIKLPAIRGSLAVAVIFSVIGSFQLFNEPNILRALAPNAISTSYTPNMYAYNLSFSGQQFNYAATVALVMGVFTMAVAYLVQVRGARRGDQ